jgi:Tfp pilus assembly protein PilO
MRILKKIAWRPLGTKKVNVFVAIGGGLLLFIVLSLLLLAPMRKSIAVKKDEWKKMDTRLIENRTKLASSLKTDKSAIEAELDALRRRLPSQSSTSAVLDELTRQGKGLNIEFVSIMPQEEKAIISQQGKLKYKILPIEINMKAGYRNLGEYLGVVERLDSNFATVGEFQVRKDPKAPPKLNVRLVVYTYILEDQSGQR